MDLDPVAKANRVYADQTNSAACVGSAVYRSTPVLSKHRFPRASFTPYNLFWLEPYQLTVARFRMARFYCKELKLPDAATLSRVLLRGVTNDALPVDPGPQAGNND